MANAWLYCTFLTNLLFVLAADNSCPKTLGLCKLKIGGDSSIQLPTKGPKGAKGDVGEPGLNGEPGNLGAKGPKGLKGNRGDTGSNGNPGFPGSLGRQGERGVGGLPGIGGGPSPMGDKGIKGASGNPGLIGPPGEDGLPGYCMCEQLQEDSGGDSDYPTDYDTISFGREEPADQACKFSSEKLKTGSKVSMYQVSSKSVQPSLRTYYLGPGPMTVTCDVRKDKNLSTLTCIPPRNATKIAVDEKKQWLSQNNFTIEDMYGINHTQIEWLHQNSISAYQIIRFHCLNIDPFPRDNEDNSMRVLTWNENSIGPMPSLTKPIFYSILTEGGCSNATEDQWTYTDIKLVSEGVRRVPVIDFYIGDIRPGKIQEVKIEHCELCFD